MSGRERESGELDPGEDFDDWFDEPELPPQPRRRGSRRAADDDDAWLIPETGGTRRSAPREPFVIAGRTVTPRQAAILAGSAIVLLLAILAAAGAFSGGSTPSTPPAAATTQAKPPTATTTPTTTPAPPSKPSVAAPTTTLKPGDTGAQVTRLQKALTALGYSPGKADGNYGPGTKTAVASFQTALSLSADGIFGSKTLAALKNALAGTTSSTAPTSTVQAPTATLKPGDTGAQVVDLQKALAALGQSPGKADGNYGASTKAAVTAFQQQQGLTADGIVGSKTLAALQSALASRG